MEANSVLLSAWNENDEGHVSEVFKEVSDTWQWIMPSLQDGTAKLEAVQRGYKLAED